MLKINQTKLGLATTVITSLMVCGPVNAASLYSVTNLGVLGTDESANSSSKAYDINELGQIVGESGNRAFIWDSSRGIQSLGVLPGKENASYIALGINDNSQVVGYSSPLSSSATTFIWEPTTGIRNLGITGSANAINNQGLVTGFNYDGGQAYIFDSKNPNLAPARLGSVGWGNDINEKGEVAGALQVSIVPRASLWNKNVNREDIGLLGDEATFLFNTSVADAVNNKSQVVGRGSVNNAQYTMGGDRAFLWDRTNGIRNLGALANSSNYANSSANDINDLGQVVGRSTIGYSSGVFNAFIWENGILSNLNNFIPSNSGWILNSAEGINERGYIVGFGTFNGQTRAFLLKPIQKVPEAATAFGLLAFAAFAIRQKRIK
jgi:probable HAF family extracellular repeat protein